MKLLKVRDFAPAQGLWQKGWNRLGELAFSLHEGRI